MNKGTILIVQGNQDQANTNALLTYLTQAGYRVLFIADQEAALMLARTEFPQSIILDLDTPGLDTAALIQQLRATPRTHHIHITLLTPRGEREDKPEFTIELNSIGAQIQAALMVSAWPANLKRISGSQITR